MPYVGRDLSRGNYLKLDDLVSQFNGSKTTFNLTTGGSAFFPGSAFSILVSLGGIVQEPESAYTINKSQITFASAPLATDEFFIIALGVALGVGVPGHGTVGGSQLTKPLEYDDYFYLDSTNNRVGIHSATPTVALDVIGDIKLNGNLVTSGTGGGGFNAGLVTCTGLDVNGNVSIAGTLTYLDVTNIDSVGIITAQNDVEFNGSGAGISSAFWDKSANEFKFKDNVKLSFGDSQDLSLYHSGSHSFISDSGTGGIKVMGSDVYIKNVSDADMIHAQSGGPVRLYNAGNKKFETTSTGAVVTGILTATTFVGALTGNVTGNITGNVTGNVTGTSSGNPTLANGADNRVITASSASAIQGESNLTFDGTTLKTINTDGSTGATFHRTFSGNVTGATNSSRIDFTLTDSATTDQVIARITPQGLPGTGDAFKGNLRFFTANASGTPTEQLRIDSDGHLTPGTAGTHDLGSTSKEFRHLYLGDSGKAFFGLDQDLSVYHNNSQAFINNTVGNLSIQTSGNLWIENQAGSKVWIKAIVDGSVELYDNNIKTFQTDANGIRVLGPDGGVGQIELFADRGDDNADKWRFQATASGSNLNIQHYTNGSWETSIKATGNSHTELYCADEKMFQTNGDGAEFFDSDSNLNIYFTTNDTTRRGYLFVETTNGGKISFYDNQNHPMLSCTKNSSVDLYHDNALRLQTSSTGISVTGEVAASQDYPTIKPTLDLNFAATKTLDSRVQYYRYGPASYVDENGKVVLVGEDVPRFDHDPDTGECKGLLVEGERRNYIPNGVRPGDKWTGSKANSTWTENTTETTAPDGTYTATKWAFTGTDPYLYHQQTLNAGVTYTLSMWVKAGTNMSGDWVQFRIGGAPYSIQTNCIIPTDGSWRRITYTKTIGGTNETNVNVGFEPQTSPSGNPASGDVIYVWGAQLESGTTASSFIPTYGYTQARGPDVVTIEGEEFTDFYNQTEGTIFLSASYETDARAAAIVNIDDTSNAGEYTEVGYRAGGASSGQVSSYIRTTSGNDQYYKNWTSSATQGNEFKIALGYKDNDYASSANGESAHTDTSGTTSRLYDRLRLSQVHTVGHGGVGHYRRLMYYSKRITDSQLVTLTS